jgi:hypothetical protein
MLDDEIAAKIISGVDEFDLNSLYEKIKSNIGYVENASQEVLQLEEKLATLTQNVQGESLGYTYSLVSSTEYG